MYTIVVHVKSKPEHVEDMKNKLVEASNVYRKDKETLDWFVMQDHKDPTMFCIVERYEQESVRSRPIAPLPASIDLIMGERWKGWWG